MLKKLKRKAMQLKGRKNISQIFVATGLLILLGLGAFGQMGWLPNTDPKTGKRTGWFGTEIAKNSESSNWNPFAETKRQTNLQLSKEYIYAGSRLLAIEEAGGGSGTPTPTPTATPTPTPTPPPGAGSVVWTDVANTVANGGSAERGTGSEYNGVAKSSQTITNGGYFEWTHNGDPDTWVGIISDGSVTSSTTESDLPYSFSGGAVREFGAYQDEASNLVVGTTKLKIEIDANGNVLYKKDDALVYTSANQASGSYRLVVIIQEVPGNGIESATTSAGGGGTPTPTPTPTATPTPTPTPPPGAGSVVWTDVANTVANGGSAERGTGSEYNGVAKSSQTITNGGYFEWTHNGDPDTWVGIISDGSVTSSTTESDLPYSFSGGAVREFGAYQDEASNLVVGTTKLKIEIDANGNVLYKKDDALVYTSANQASGSYRLVVIIQEVPGNGIESATTSAGGGGTPTPTPTPTATPTPTPTPPPGAGSVVWTDVANTVANGGSAERGTGSEYNGVAKSSQTITNGGYFEWTHNGDPDTWVGIISDGSVTSSTTESDLPYSFSGGAVREFGAYQDEASNLVVGTTKLKIEIDANGNVLYKKDDALVYTSANQASGSYRLVVIIQEVPGNGIENATTGSASASLFNQVWEFLGNLFFGSTDGLNTSNRKRFEPKDAKGTRTYQQTEQALTACSGSPNNGRKEEVRS